MTRWNVYYCWILKRNEQNPWRISERIQENVSFHRFVYSNLLENLFQLWWMWLVGTWFQRISWKTSKNWPKVGDDYWTVFCWFYCGLFRASRYWNSPSSGPRQIPFQGIIKILFCSFLGLLKSIAADLNGLRTRGLFSPRLAALIPTGLSRRVPGISSMPPICNSDSYLIVNIARRRR